MGIKRLTKCIALALCCCALVGFGKKFRLVEVEWIFVEGNSYHMGDKFEDGKFFEKPVHEVKLSDFHISKYEITFAQYEAYCDATGKSKPDDNGWGRGNRPVINVSWEDANAFCEWMTEKTGDSIRLPSEAEWEYAAREGGKGIRFGNGENVADPSKINFLSSMKCKKGYSLPGVSRYKTTPVGSFVPNALGLHDMSGNVREWCSDWFNVHYYGKCPMNDPKGPSWGTQRVNRGGSYASVSDYVRCTYRSSAPPSWRYKNIGFRCVMEK